MREYTVFSGSYRGIGWSGHRIKASDSMKEISRRNYDWTHYIHVCLDQLPVERREELWLPAEVKERSVSGRKYITYDYYKGVVGDIEFHGGCTFYEKKGGLDNAPRWVKIGCDYQHIWDDGYYYNETDVEREAKESIDSLHSLIPNIGVHCWHGYCGKEYHLESEGLYMNDKSSFLCLFCEDKRQKEVAEREKVAK